MIIGRKREQQKLNDLYNSGMAEFVAIYGRRRVGKTFLVDETLGSEIIFRHAGLSPISNDNDSVNNKHLSAQLEHFYRSLVAQGSNKTQVPSSWLEAFYLLEDFLSEKDDGTRLLVFLDEIQWMDTPKSGFMTGLEAFWNGWACHKHNIMVIVCGSSTSWILDKLVNNHGGMYGRLTYQIELNPFDLSECEQFFRQRGFSLSRYDIVQAYMSVGGIPYYLNFFDRTLSIPQNIQAMFFERNAPLKDEFDRLFSSLFVNPEIMKSIVIALNTKSRGLTRRELLDKTCITDSGSFSRMLKSLESGSFIIKYDSFGNGKRESFYKLIDPFCIFYLRFVGDSSIKREWLNISDTQTVAVWRGLSFENVCFNHIAQIKFSLGISGVSTNESLWSKRGNNEEDGAQIDLIIVRRDNVVNMCEIKFYSDEYIANKDCHFALVRKERLLREVIPNKASIHKTLITTFGLKHIEYFGDFTNTITLDDLFREL